MKRNRFLLTLINLKTFFYSKLNHFPKQNRIKNHEIIILVPRYINGVSHTGEMTVF